MRDHERNGESGQILIVVATALFFVLLGAGSVTVDLGNGLLQQRRLQNVADSAAIAAASELSAGGTTASAVSVAQSMVSSSTGGAVTLPTTPTGSGAGLTNGIEISDGTVRVAINRQVPTFLAQAIGVNTLNVSARARAGTTYQGILPVAAKRYSAGNTTFALGTGTNPDQVVDYIARASAPPLTSWPASLSASSPYPPDYTPPSAYDPNVSGPVAPFIGHDALANVANGNDFHFWVAPDVRQITAVSPKCYNGIELSDSIQHLKDVESSYFHPGKGYPGEPPRVGDEIAALNGVNQSYTVDSIRKSFRRGSIVTAMVYNGTVYRKPDFSLQMDEVVKTSMDIGPLGSPIHFRVTIVPINNFTGSVELSAMGLDAWGDWQFGSAAANTPYAASLAGSPVTVDLYVSSPTTVSGARTLLIMGTGSGLPRTATATVVVGGVEAYSVSTAQSYLLVEQSSSTRFNLDLIGWNGYGPSDVNVGSIEWVGGYSPSGVSMSYSSNPVSNVRSGHTSGLRLNVDVGPSAPVGQYTLKVPFRDGTTSRDQDVYLTLQIVAPESASNIAGTTSFVKVLGYANFVITYFNNSPTPTSQDNNTIFAYAVSDIVPSPNLLSRGRAARLIPWR